MVGEPPLEVALGTAHRGKKIDEIAHAVGAHARALFVPVMGQGDEDAGMGIAQSHRVVDDAGRAHVGLEITCERLVPHVGPDPRLVDLVVNDPVADAGGRPGKTITEQMNRGPIVSGAPGLREVRDGVDPAPLGLGVGHGMFYPIAHEKDAADDDLFCAEML